eukprot:403364010
MDSQQQDYDQRLQSQQQQRLNFYQSSTTKQDYFESRINFSNKIRRDTKNSIIQRKRLNGIQADMMIQTQAQNVGSNNLMEMGDSQQTQIQAPVISGSQMIIIDGQSQAPDQHQKVLTLLQKLIGLPVDLAQTKDQKQNLQYLRELRQALITHQDTQTFHQFIQKGGIQVLAAYLNDQSVSQQLQEEAIWALTNMSIFSGQYEAEFLIVCDALLMILHSEKIENLGSVLNLKQQALQTLGNLAIDSEKMRQKIMNYNPQVNGLKVIIDLMFFNRVQLSEMCLWTLNNFIIADPKYIIVCIQEGLCKAIVHTMDKIQKKTPELMSELLWCLNYMTNSEDVVIFEILKEIPDIHKRVSSELPYASQQFDLPFIRPIISIIGNIVPLRLEYGHELMYDERFQTFLLTVLFQPDEITLYKKECLWVLSNILAGPSEHNFEFILENKNLLQQIINLAKSQDYLVKKEALVTLYNLCENHENRYLQKVMQKDPSSAFFSVLKNYFSSDPYLLKIAISYCSLICEKYPDIAIKLIFTEGISEMIENIQYKFENNQELVMLSSSFLEKFIYSQSHDSDLPLDDNNINAQLNNNGSNNNNQQMSFNI